MHSFRKMHVWKNAMNLVELCYTIVDDFPPYEKHILSQQILRSAISIPSNIAEGSSRMSKKEFGHFLSIALGSCYELETQLIICSKRNYVDMESLEHVRDLVVEIEKMIYSFRKKLIADL